MKIQEILNITKNPNRKISILLFVTLLNLFFSCKQSEFNKMLNNYNPIVCFYVTTFNKTEVDTICMYYHEFYEKYAGINPLFHDSKETEDYIVNNIKNRNIFVLSDSLYSDITQDDSKIVHKQPDMLFVYESKGIQGIIQNFVCINNRRYQLKDQVFTSIELNYLIYLLNIHNIYPYFSDMHGCIVLLDNIALQGMSNKISSCSGSIN